MIDNALLAKLAYKSTLEAYRTGLRRALEIVQEESVDVDKCVGNSCIIDNVFRRAEDEIDNT